MVNRPANITSSYSIIIIAFFFIQIVLILFSCKKETSGSSVVTPPSTVTDLHMVPFDTLSKARYGIVAGAAGNKMLFAGGMYGENCFVPGGDYGAALDVYDSIASVCLRESNRVDIYDTATHSWSTHELARYYVLQHAITIGNKIYFTGGVDTADRNYSKRIDIYDAAADSWSVSAEWSKPRHSMGVGSLGNKIFFAGGFEYTGLQNKFVSNKVDIYDVSSNSWSVGIATLSESRCAPVVASVGNRILFAGGNSCGWGSISGRVDIYDGATNTWSVSDLSETRALISSIVIDDKVFFVGGSIPIDFRNGIPSYKMDVYNNTTQSWSVKQIDFFMLYSPSVLMMNKGYFFSGGRTVNIYNHSIDSWSVGLLDQELNGPAIIAVGNQVYFAGGGSHYSQTNKIWKLAF